MSHVAKVENELNRRRMHHSRREASPAMPADVVPTDQAALAAESAAQTPNSNAAIAREARVKHANHVLEKIHASLERLDIKIAKASSPAHLEKLRQERAALAGRVAEVAGKSANPDAGHVDDHHEVGHSDEHSAQVELHAVAGELEESDHDERREENRHRSGHPRQWANTTHGVHGMQAQR